MLMKLNKLLRDQRGATAIEYVIIVALVAICALGAYQKFGENVTKSIKNVNTQITNSNVKDVTPDKGE